MFVPADEAALLHGRVAWISGGPIWRPNPLTLVPIFNAGEDVDGLYARLGLKPGASLDEVNAAYRELLFETHPDKGGDHDEFVAIQAAFQTLSNPRTKAKYDQDTELDRFLRDLKDKELREAQKEQEELRLEMAKLMGGSPGSGDPHQGWPIVGGSFWTGGVEPLRPVVTVQDVDRLVAARKEDRVLAEMCFGERPWNRDAIPEGTGFAWPWVFGIWGAKADEVVATLNTYHMVLLANTTFCLAESGFFKEPAVMVLGWDCPQTLTASRWREYPAFIVACDDGVWSNDDLMEVLDEFGAHAARAFWRS